MFRYYIPSVDRATVLDRSGLSRDDLVDLLGDLQRQTRQLAAPPPGLSIHPLDPAGDEAEWAKFVDVLNTVLQDTPDHAQGSEGESSDLLRAFLPEPWQVMLARDGERSVEFTSLSVHTAQVPTLYTHMTGVERDYRGRRLATALKAAHALSVRERGWRRIVTHNLAGNVPILASNKTLGFRRTRAMQDLTCDFDPPSHGI